MSTHHQRQEARQRRKSGETVRDIARSYNAPTTAISVETGNDSFRFKQRQKHPKRA